MKGHPFFLVLAAAVMIGIVTFNFRARPGQLRDLRQLTTNGHHAEAYWAPDGSKLVMMGVREGDKADQIYTLDMKTGELVRISNGEGKKTCGYFLNDGRLIYSSTHHHGAEPPPPPDRSKGYGWPFYRTFDIFRREADGSMTPLTRVDGYDAEATVSPDGKKIVFTSHREDENGDEGIGIWTMNIDGTDPKRITKKNGYAGGAFFSPDGTKLIYRAFYPGDDEEKKAAYKKMLQERMLRPVPLQIFLYDLKTDTETQLTDNEATNWAPSFHPSGRTIIYMSNLGREGRAKRFFSLYEMDVEGKNVRRLTEGDHFDGFPHYSPDGKRLVFVSDRVYREGEKPGRNFNVILADWR